RRAVWVFTSVRYHRAQLREPVEVFVEDGLCDHRAGTFYPLALAASSSAGGYRRNVLTRNQHFIG
ncbi:MAG TPA: hypothetical protein VHX16_04565, partial [Chloroflexota bacterium]|nr:hypothetical protein [Chloroflexota bacterium]